MTELSPAEQPIGPEHQAPAWSTPSALAPAPAPLVPDIAGAQPYPAPEPESGDQPFIDITGGQADAPSRRGATSAAAKDRQLIRRTVAKLVELSEADRKRFELAAALIGVSSATVPELTVAIMSASSKDLQPAADARSVMDADPLECGVVATALGRKRLRQVWRLFTALGVVSGDCPSSEPKAAIGIVRGLQATDAAGVRTEIEQALVLLKK